MNHWQKMYYILLLNKRSVEFQLETLSQTNVGPNKKIQNINPNITQTFLDLSPFQHQKLPAFQATHLPQKSLLHLPPAPWSGKLAYQRQANKAPESLAPTQCHNGTKGTVNQPYHLSVHSWKTLRWRLWICEVCRTKPNVGWSLVW